MNLASRLQTLAEPGGILISEAMHELVAGYVDSSFAGEHQVKGKAEPQRVHRLDGLKSGVTRFDVSVNRGLTRLIGRRQELESLERCWQDAAQGEIRIVDVVGEAGIGKSRLVYELRRRAIERKLRRGMEILGLDVEVWNTIDDRIDAPCPRNPQPRLDALERLPRLGTAEQ